MSKEVRNLKEVNLIVLTSSDGEDYRGTVLSSKEVEDLLHEQCLQLTKGTNYIQSPDPHEVHHY